MLCIKKFGHREEIPNAADHCTKAKYFFQNGLRNIVCDERNLGLNELLSFGRPIYIRVTSNDKFGDLCTSKMFIICNWCPGGWREPLWQDAGMKSQETNVYMHLKHPRSSLNSTKSFLKNW